MAVFVKCSTFNENDFSHFLDFDLTESKVRVTITGKVLDMDYATLLARSPDLSLSEIIMLDKVQKKLNLTEGEEKYLRGRKLVEGRKPNFYIALRVAQKTGQKAVYSKNKAFDKSYYLDLIEKAIKEHGFVERTDVDELLWKKLPEWMNEKQKKVKINNLLSELRRKGKIRNTGPDRKPIWVTN